MSNHSWRLSFQIFQVIIRVLKVPSSVINSCFIITCICLFIYLMNPRPHLGSTQLHPVEEITFSLFYFYLCFKTAFSEVYLSVSFEYYAVTKILLKNYVYI